MEKLKDLPVFERPGPVNPIQPARVLKHPDILKDAKAKQFSEIRSR
jgi:hypothetical protein